MAVFLFGLAGLFGKLVDSPALVIVTGRTLFATAILLPLVLLRKSATRVTNRRDQLLLILSGALLAGHWLTFFISIKVSSVAIGLLTYSSFPLFVTFLEPLFFSERLRLPDAAFALAVAFGLVLVIPSFDLGDQTTQGILWGTLSGLAFAVLSLVNRGLVSRQQPMTIALNQNLFATLALAPFLFKLEHLPSSRDLLLLAFLGIFCTALAHALFIRSLRVIKVSLAGVIAALEPVYGIVIAVLVIGEIPAERTLLGGSVILLTTLIATRFRQR